MGGKTLAAPGRSHGRIRALLLAVLAAAAMPGPTHAGEAGGAAGKLFVDVSEADYIEVVDLATRKVVDKIVVGQRPHGVAFHRHRIDGRLYDLLYVTVEEAGELVVVDAASHRVLARLPVGKVPNQLTLTRDGRFAYVPLRGEAKVAVVEVTLEPPEGQAPAAADSSVAVRLKLLQRIPIGEWPHNSYTGRATGRVFVTSFRGKKIHVFHPGSHELLFEIEFPGEVRPVALTRDETRAYVAQSDFHGLVAVDVPARKVVQRVRLPALPPDTPEPFLKTYVHGLALSPDERELWVTSCAGAAVYVYSLPGLELKGKVPTGRFPHWFAWQPPTDSAAAESQSGWLLWVSEMDSDQVSAIDPATRRVVSTVRTGAAPRRIVVAPPPAKSNAEPPQ